MILQKCRRCSQFRHPAEFVAGPNGYCLHCLEWHRKALDLLAGNPPPGCQECERTFAQLEDSAGNARMYLHVKDGLYSLLCKSCSDAYERKRADLYGGTPYGRVKGIG